MKNKTKKMQKIEKKKSKYFYTRFQPDINIGLLSSQVAARQQDGLINKAKKHYSKTYGQIFKEKFLTLFNILLIIIGIALISIGQWNQCLFLIVLVLNIGIGVFQDIRAKHTIDKLRLVTAPNAEVIRDAREMTIPSDQIVLDDILVLSQGKQISTDAIVRNGVVEVNESLLTGEAIAVKKKKGDTVYAGSYVTSGTAVVQVERIGDDNYAEQLQRKAKVVDKPKSELLRSLNLIFHMISFIIIPLGIIMAVGNIVQISNEDMKLGAKVTDVISRTAGSLVSMIPSGMFLLTSMTLYTGVIRLGKKRTSVQELYSIEMLARVDTLCLDKTGTITDGTMSVEDVIVFDDFKGIDLDSLMGSYLKAVNDSNQTAVAMMQKYPFNNAYEPISVLPFSSDRKCSAVSFKGKGTYLFGAPEYVYKGKDKEILKQIRHYTSRGTRVLMLAYTKSKLKGDNVPQDAEPVSLFILYDRIKEDAAKTIAWFRKNDVNVKIISGDNPIAVSEIARLVGVETANQYISLEGMPLDEVAAIANDYTVFGRVTPEQKAVIIESLRNNKRTVAMIGDGVNDILSLKKADCAIAMAAGSEAAMDVAHLVLLDSNFSVLPDIVAEGRRAISNLQNVSSLFLNKTIFSIFFSIIWAVVMFSILPPQYKVFPFSTNNFYVWEMLAIGLASFFMAIQPNKKRISGNFVTNVIQKALPGGIAITLGVSAYFVFRNQGILDFDIPEGGTKIAAETCSCILMYVMSYVVLLRVCLPFNKYRGILFASCVSLGVLAILVTELIATNSPESLLGISIKSLSGDNVKGLFIVLIPTLVFYYISDRLLLTWTKTK